MQTETLIATAIAAGGLGVGASAACAPTPASDRTATARRSSSKNDDPTANAIAVYDRVADGALSLVANDPTGASSHAVARVKTRTRP